MGKSAPPLFSCSLTFPRSLFVIPPLSAASPPAEVRYLWAGSHLAPFPAVSAEMLRLCRCLVWADDQSSGTSRSRPSQRGDQRVFEQRLPRLLRFKKYMLVIIKCSLSNSLSAIYSKCKQAKMLNMFSFIFFPSQCDIKNK